MAQAQSRDQLRILLVGKAGVGKSATGNSLLGGNLFPSRASVRAVTEQCATKKRKREGREIVVMDTPGFLDPEKAALTESDAQAWLQELQPGPHAILLVVKVGRMTEQEKDCFGLVRKLFGGGEPFLVLLFTHKDALDHDGLTFSAFLEAADEELKELLAAAGNRCFAINNIAQGEEKEQQAAELLGMIDSLASTNGRNRSFYSEEMFESVRKMEKLEREVEELREEVEKWKQLAKEKGEQNEGRKTADCSVEESENQLKIEKLQKENEKPRKQNGGGSRCNYM